MAHNIDMTNGRANMAFMGSRTDIWHSLGQEMKPGMSIAEWAKAAGLDWHVEKVPAFADVPGFGMQRVEGARHIVRMDTSVPLGYVSDLDSHEWRPRWPVSYPRNSARARP